MPAGDNMWCDGGYLLSKNGANGTVTVTQNNPYKADSVVVLEKPAKKKAQEEIDTQFWDPFMARILITAENTSF